MARYFPSNCQLVFCPASTMYCSCHKINLSKIFVKQVWLLYTNHISGRGEDGGRGRAAILFEMEQLPGKECHRCVFCLQLVTSCRIFVTILILI